MTWGQSNNILEIQAIFAATQIYGIFEWLLVKTVSYLGILLSAHNNWFQLLK